MRKREIKLNDCKIYYNKLIAMVFVPNRFSQKLGRWEDILLPKTEFSKKFKAILVPFNFKKYKNNKTIIKRLNEFDYVLVHETDIDVIEKLKELNINFRILPLEIKQGCLNCKKKPQYLSYVSDEWYISSNFLDLYNIIPKSETYYIIENEYHCPKIKEVIINPSKDTVYSWMYKSKKEAYDKYVYQLKLEIQNYSETVQNKEILLNYFVNKYKGEI